MVKKTLEIMYCSKLRCLSERRVAGPVRALPSTGRRGSVVLNGAWCPAPVASLTSLREAFPPRCAGPGPDHWQLPIYFPQAFLAPHT